MRLVTTFPSQAECEKAIGLLHSLSLPFTVLSPEPGYARVAVPAIVVDEEVRSRVASLAPWRFSCSGWVDYQPATTRVPESRPPEFDPDVFGQILIMVLQSCLGDPTKIRAIAHITGDLSGVFPYMNAVMPDAFYNPQGPAFTWRDGYRMITLYPRRIAVAKADEIVDLWRVLELLRVRFNTSWQHRGEITPSFTLRERPPALEIYHRLPRTNCGACGETTCLAFAFKLWAGLTPLFRCAPVFSGDYRHLEGALLEICAGLGVRKEQP